MSKYNFDKKLARTNNLLFSFLKVEQNVQPSYIVVCSTCDHNLITSQLKGI